MAMAKRWSSLALALYRARGLQTVVATRNYGTKQESKLWQQKPNRNPRLSIILTEDVHNLGVKGQMVDVKRGYGRNHLILRNKAVYATHNNIVELNPFVVEKATVSNTKAIEDYLHDKVLCVRHDPNDASAIFEQHISTCFYETMNLHVPLDCILLEEPITDFASEHEVGVQLDSTTVVTVPVVIERTLSKKKQRRIEQLERFHKKKESAAKLQEL